MSCAALILVVATTAVVAGSIACSDGPISPPDDPGSPPSGRTAAALAKVTGDDQTATVKSRVGVRPVVRIADADDAPLAGVTVTFSVARGGGSVIGPQVITDSLGLATVGAWTLGGPAGANTLNASVDNLTVTFRATGTPGPAARATRLTDDLLSGTVGLPIAVRPAVLVNDAYANPVGGVTVTFTVTVGGGSTTGDTVVTNSLGHATVGSWILGTLAGANSLVAGIAGLPGVTFTATGRAGPPASVTKLAGDGQTGDVFNAVDTLPAVLVRDAYANPVAGVLVTFSIVSGNGQLAGVTPVTNSNGTAQVGVWTLGPAPGPNTLMAAITGLPAVSFTAVAVDHCSEATPYAIGSTVDGALSTGDCRLPSGEYTDLYAVTVPTASSLRFGMTPSAYDPHLTLFDGIGALVAFGAYYCDDHCDGAPSSVRVLLPAGAYIAGAGGFTWDDDDCDSYDDYCGFRVAGVGPYSFSSAAVPEDVTGCEVVFITRGVTTTQRVDTTDCAGTSRGSTYFYDQFSIYLTAGQTYTITMSSAEFDTYLELSGGTVNDDFGGSSDSQITFTPTWSGLHVIQAATYKGNTTGSYTLIIQ